MSRLDAALRRAQQLNEQPQPRRADVPRLTPRDTPRETVRPPESPPDVPRMSTEPVAGLSSLKAGSCVAGKLVVTADLEQSAVEQYRKLAATLHHAQAERNLKIVMISSAVSGDGKTLTSTNLALTLSESYRRRVLLIDADLRKPSLHGIFGAGDAGGLSECLTCEDERPLPVVQVSQYPSVVVAAPP